MKPYQRVQIKECGEPLSAIPLNKFAVVSPHPYVALGAPYGDFSPYFLRESILQRLFQAQEQLQQHNSNWRLQIFDAYRPIPVQQFMVDYTFAQLVQAEGLDSLELSKERRSHFQEKVAAFWAIPNPDPAMPPPHSTGAAVDLTLIDGEGIAIDMGSAIDEISPRSYPNHFEKSDRPAEKQYHYHRSILAQVMSATGFRQHPNEWWHFSQGDQLWAWQVGDGAIAQYGNAQPV